MSRKFLLLVGLVVLLGGGAAYILLRPGPSELVLTGVVTTDDVILGPEVGGRVSRMLVAEGDSVAKGELLAELAPAELEASRTYYGHSERAMVAQVAAARAGLQAAVAADSEASANVDHARRTYERDSAVALSGGISAQDLDQVRTAWAVAAARAEAAHRQVAAARSSLTAARQQSDAAAAQTTRADVVLGYTQLRAPISGIVDVRAARVGEVISAGQPVLTLIDPDSLWVRADVEESYIDRIRLGDTLTVRLPSGDTLPGVIYYRGVDADFATQRDVSRTKRDIKTFQVRLRVDNHDRRLAVGMTAYVLLPLGRGSPADRSGRTDSP